MVPRQFVGVLVLVLALAACGPSMVGEPSDPAPGNDRNPVDPDDNDWPDAEPPDDLGEAPVEEVPSVYAHSADSLYQVDPTTLAVTLIAPFAFPLGDLDSMTDIALDSAGHMVGISFSTVYGIDKPTAACSFVGYLDRSFNGLSFVPASDSGGDGPESLVAAANDGSFYRLDRLTGISTLVGAYGGDYRSSGDIVSVAGFGTVATAKSGSIATDLLVRVDPATGQVTPIGETGVTHIWGLGYWGDKVYGFTEGHQFVLIDVTTGRASTVPGATDVSWWGAGVTTAAPVIN